MKRKVLALSSIFLAMLLLVRPPLGTANISVGYSQEKSCFSVAYRGEVSPFKITSLFVLPGEDVKLSIDSHGEKKTFTVVGSKGAWQAMKSGDWSWKAPLKAGIYPAVVTEVATGEVMKLNVIVMVPYGKMREGRINGYRIGTYPKVSSSKAAVYGVPRGFIEVTDENKNTLISPHFKLGQFLCKQSAVGTPRYVVLRERLVLKLEHLLEHVNREGLAARTFSVMSGYRTPAYNKSLGNVRLSRHMWGDAADVYINNNNPNALGMEDLNGDGKQDVKDAQLLYQVMGEKNDDSDFNSFLGGLGWYKPTKSHGPFVHVDARGTPANWGSN